MPAVTPLTLTEAQRKLLLTAVYVLHAEIGRADRASCERSDRVRELATLIESAESVVVLPR